MGTMSTLFNREEAEAEIDSSEVQYRYCEMEFDGKRTISGTAMRYGDIAVFEFGGKERFEPGAFAEVGGKDIILNFQHQRARPLARTGNGGLTLTDTPTELRLSAELPETRDADDALELVRAKVIRGLSVEFVPKRWHVEGDTLVIERADLRNVAMVDRPQYKKSLLMPRSENTMLDEKAVAEMIKTELEKRTDKDQPVDPTLLARSIVESLNVSTGDMIKTQVTDQVASALTERDQANAAKDQAESEKRESEEKAVKERDEIERTAEKRSDLIVQFRALLPEGFDPKGKKVKEILVAAAGKEIEKAEERSEDYLLARLESIVERREEADKSRNPSGGQPSSQGNKSVGGTVNMVRFIEQNQKRV